MLKIHREKQPNTSKAGGEMKHNEESKR